MKKESDLSFYKKWKDQIIMAHVQYKDGPCYFTGEALDDSVLIRNGEEGTNEAFYFILEPRDIVRMRYGKGNEILHTFE